MKFIPLSRKQSGAIAGSVVLLDQLTKFWVARTFDEPESAKSFVVVPQYLQIIYRVNTGAAFSVFTEHPWALTLFSTMVASGLLVWGFRLLPEEQILRWPLTLIFGGAVGNLIDRYRIGHVIDFIDAHWNERYHFPTFNAADSAICMGMALLIFMSLTAPNRK